MTTGVSSWLKSPDDSQPSQHLTGKPISSSHFPEVSALKSLRFQELGGLVLKYSPIVAMSVGVDQQIQYYKDIFAVKEKTPVLDHVSCIFWTSHSFPLPRSLQWRRGRQDR